MGMSIDEGIWYRIRTIYASVEYDLEVTLVETSGARCELMLLATDGVYLPEAPRQVTKISLASGGRADVAITCNCVHGGQPCKGELRYRAKFAPIGLPSWAIPLAWHDGTLMKLVVGPSGKTIQPPPLPSFSTPRPCYLVDLRDLQGFDVPRGNHHSLTLPELPPFKLSLDGVGFIFPGPSHISTGWTPVTPNISTGELHQWELSGTAYHPAHIHVNHFQIVDMIDSHDDYGGFYRPGDWHDTVFTPHTGKVVTRQTFANFPGRYIIHCHILEHEDNGMMSFIEVGGKEGPEANWEHAKDLDPKCYTGHFKPLLV